MCRIVASEICNVYKQTQSLCRNPFLNVAIIEFILQQTSTVSLWQSSELRGMFTLGEGNQGW